MRERFSLSLFLLHLILRLHLILPPPPSRTHNTPPPPLSSGGASRMSMVKDALARFVHMKRQLSPKHVFGLAYLTTHFNWVGSQRGSWWSWNAPPCRRPCVRQPLTLRPVVLWTLTAAGPRAR